MMTFLSWLVSLCSTYIYAVETIHVAGHGYDGMSKINNEDTK